MRQYSITALLALICFGCMQAGNKPEGMTENSSGEKLFYIETENFGTDLDSCFENSIRKTWRTPELQQRHSSEAFSGKAPREKHFFYDIREFKEPVRDQKVEKILIRLKGDRTLPNTRYSIERYQYSGNGAWRIIANLGDFTAKDRDNDSLSPGSLDIDELCGQIIEMTMKAGYK